MAKGELASAEAVRFLNGYLSAQRIGSAMEGGREAVEDLLRAATRAAHEAVLSAVAQSPEERQGMSSTVVMGLLGHGALTVANLGDSRAYLLRGSRIDLLTQDHTVAAGLLAIGEMNATEARHSSLRNTLTACLGHEHYQDPFLTTLSLHAGDRALLCSDGLWDMLEDAEIAKIVRSAPTPQEAVESLIDAANQAGGHDNITVIALFFSGDETVEHPIWEMTTLSGSDEPVQLSFPGQCKRVSTGNRAAS